MSHVHTPHLGAYSQAHAELPLLYVPNHRFRFSAKLPVYTDRRQPEVDFILEALEQDRKVPGPGRQFGRRPRLRRQICRDDLCRGAVHRGSAGVLRRRQGPHGQVRPRSRSPEGDAGLSFAIGRSRQEAQDKFDALEAAVDFGGELDLMGHDVSGYPLDGPLPDLPEPANGKGR